MSQQSNNTAHYNKIVIIQSLKEGRTGTHLEEDINASAVFKGAHVRAEVVDVESKQGLYEALKSIQNAARGGAYMPLIHFETHGNSDPPCLALVSGETVPWTELQCHLAPINEATRFNLIISVAACFGAGIVNAVNPMEPSPCWGLVGPLERRNAGDLLRDFLGFYEELIVSKDGDKALRRLNGESLVEDAPYYFTTAEKFFEVVWIRLINEEHVGAGFNQQVDQTFQKANQQGKRLSRNEVINILRQSQRKTFEDSVQRFFMHDKCPDNKVRFNVSSQISRIRSTSR